MIDASILNEKALYEESRQKLSSAGNLALKYEDWKVLLEVLHKEYTIASLTADPSQLEKELRRINADEKKIIAQLNNYAELAYLAISLTMMLRKYHAARDKSKVPSIKKIVAHPLLKKESGALSFRSKSIFYYIWSSYLMGTFQYEKAEPYLLKHINLYEHHPHFTQAAPGNYLGALRDLLISRYRIARYSDVMQMIEQLKKMPDSNAIRRINTRRFRLVIFSWTFKIEVGVALKTRQFMEQMNAIQEQEAFFQRQGTTMDRGARLETLLALAVFYYYLKDHKKAVQLIGKIVNEEVSGSNHEILIAARMLQVIIHFEEGNYDVLEYLASGMKRMMKQHSFSKTQINLVDLAMKITRIHRVADRKEFFAGYLRKFSELKKDRFEKHHYDYFDVTTWLAKVSGISN
jgi:hypothetical protein